MVIVMAKLTMVQAINLALDQEMENDNSVVVLGEDVGVNGGVFRVTEGLFAKYGRDRVIDTPLAESTILGSSIGMAIAGLRPVCEMQFSGFAYLSLPNLEAQASRLRTRSRGKFNVPLVVRMPFGGGVHAIEHHSESKEAYFAHTPGLKTLIPSTPRKARALMLAAIRDPDPVVFMEPKRSYRSFKEEIPDEEEVAEIGKADIVKEGTDITLITWGAMYRDCSKVVEAIEEEKGYSIEFIDLMTISPLDSHTIAKSVQKTGRCVIVQEAQKTFGVASEIIAQVNDRCLMYLQAPINRVTCYDIPVPNFAREHMYLPSQGRISRAIEETINYQ
jgi:pyruvate dehydrogenase E1 component beta subunit